MIRAMEADLFGGSQVGEDIEAEKKADESGLQQCCVLPLSRILLAASSAGSFSPRTCCAYSAGTCGKDDDKSSLGDFASPTAPAHLDVLEIGRMSVWRNGWYIFRTSDVWHCKGFFTSTFQSVFITFAINKP